ncbi:MAG: hypothetical protein R3236_02075, partial [Phycisphaeraceae bacterium]|nr:hypothetical protein [Phycisphaeraceae bacterium]
MGRWVERRGNRVDFQGLKISVDCPAITTPQKSTLYYNLYETEEIEAIGRHLNPGLPVIELGACIGVLSCLTNRKLTDPSRHAVVEANPDLIETLQANRAANGCSFEIHHGAIAYGASEV